MAMDNKDVNRLVSELIELCDKKYGHIKVGIDTLHTDVLFIEKFERLKEILGVNSLNDIDITNLPKIKELQDIVKKINDLEINKQNRNVRMKKATNAYKK